MDDTSKKRRWKERRQSEMDFVPKVEAKIYRLSRALDSSETILEMIKSGKLDADEVLKIQRILETNGYSRADMFHLPYSFIERILGSSER